MSDLKLARPLSFHRFLKQWLSQRWPWVLTLLLGVLIPLQVFLILTLEIWRHQGGFQWDISILEQIHKSASPTLDAFVMTFTHFGTAWGVFPASALISIALLLYRRWRSLTYFLVTLLGCGLINHTAKIFLRRDRPSLWDYPETQGFSFPSGHAMSSMVLVAALVVLSWKTSWRWRTLSLGSVFVVAIGWTRLYLGVHYPSDILAGWMVALAWAVGMSLIVRPHFHPPHLLNTPPENLEDEMEDSLLKN